MSTIGQESPPWETWYALTAAENPAIRNLWAKWFPTELQAMNAQRPGESIVEVQARVVRVME
jgi:hypothetical protein